MERYVRDTRVHRVLEGTNEIMRVIISRQALMDGAGGYPMSISPSEKVLVSIEDGIANVTINNPRSQYLGSGVFRLETVVNELNGMANVRALVIRQERSFQRR